MQGSFAETPCQPYAASDPMTKIDDPQLARLRRTIFPALTLAALLISISTEAQLSSNLQAMIDRISSGEFGADSRGGGGRRGAGGGPERHWVDGGLGRYDTATGERKVVITANELTPPKLEKPLTPADMSLSDSKRLLFAMNP